jgi:penicillin-binding protein 1A
MSLGRSDLAGKTGTTNDFLDAWFAGYQASLVAVSWMGHSTPRSLGNGETGGTAALPIWMGYMGVALKGVAEQLPSPPEGVVSARIDPASGMRVADGQSGISEFFYLESPPRDAEGAAGAAEGRSADEVKSQIF